MPTESGFGPWNPGIESQVPLELRHLSTIFRPENAFTSVASARELRGLTGFNLSELVAFRPQRLALHEVLVRVTTDFAVPDGSRIEDLGINFRRIARVLLTRYIEPRMNAVVSTYDGARLTLEGSVNGVLAGIHRGWGPVEIAECERQAHSALDPAHAVACKALSRVMSALFATEGQAWGSKQLIARMATDMACNDYAGDCIGNTLHPWLHEAANIEGYRLLPRQEHPVVINTKGASASGKSSLRPLQKSLAGDIGVEWNDFALISPDIWRKQLLDYSTLGETYKYAGAFTAEELQIVDQKLDRYMARKHRRGDMSHLLIDRFRFDSFAPDSDQAGSNLLTRFGHYVYLFFMITPPAMLVERAWKRGLEFGRYKAVDDTLAHAVEAYCGIPDVFFTWVRRSDKRIHFEFLDNSVPFGERPRTVAFGDNDTFNILDVGGILDIERFGRIDVDARTPAALYRDAASLEPARNTGFLRRCVKEFRRVTFAEQSTGRIYLRIESGVPVALNRAALQISLLDADTAAGIGAVAPGAVRGEVSDTERSHLLLDASAASQPTLGQWGEPWV